MQTKKLLLWIAITCLTPAIAHAAKVTAHTGEITLPTYGWAANKHPHFRGTDGRNIYPYPMLDFLSRDKTNRTYRTVVLENEYLRITFLPELGGKIHEVLDKTTGQPMFYVNHVIKPGLIGQCGAWTSGGVEWNTGPQGHTVSCMQPVDVVILPPEKDGSRSVAIGETERIYRTKWTVVVTLRPGRSFIEERIRIYNPTETIRPYYFWNCTAVPNTPGFRFIYPMTLGCDHAGEKFFNWPVDNGKDLTRGTNYQDASSIFAWHCDQDFFGSYNDDLGRGVVAYANHHQLPGKKAWTWGQGGFGKMHQMDLTDDDGPYNEVQTGPLLTQAQVGRLDPCEAVEWKEWWYPIHGLGGFTFANKDVAVQAERDGTNLTLRLMGSGLLQRVVVLARPLGSLGSPVGRVNISPREPVSLTVGIPPHVIAAPWFSIELRHRGQRLALFDLPLNLPKLEPPPRKPESKTAPELAEAGWEDLLFARHPQAEERFRKALENDPKSASALTGLAFLRLEADPKAAGTNATAALAVEPSCGLAHYALALAEDRSATIDDGAAKRKSALSEAWESSLDPASAAAGRALVAKLHMRYFAYREAVNALAEPGPWQSDPLCRNRLALAFFELGEKAEAVRLAQENLQVDPLDYFARSILWRANAETDGLSFVRLVKNKPDAVLNLAEEYWDLLQDHWEPVIQLLAEFFTDPATGKRSRMDYNWDQVTKFVGSLRLQFAKEFLPYQLETVSVLENALELWFDDHPNNGKAALLLGHLLFHLGRHAEGREMWKRAAKLGAEPVIAYRALGMAAKTLDNDLPSAREWLTKANQADPKDSIVARDLANVLFALADKAESDAEKRALATEARDRLQAAFAEGKGRSDFVALLARAQNRLDEFTETARMLDTVRVTIWEGAHEVHDLFVQSHLALGEAHLRAVRASEALAEFNRALEYPANLATGKLENAREAHINYARGNALAALARKADATAAWKLAADEPESKDEKIQAARKKAKEALDQVSQ